MSSCVACCCAHRLYALLLASNVYGHFRYRLCPVGIGSGRSRWAICKLQAPCPGCLRSTAANSNCGCRGLLKFTAITARWSSYACYVSLVYPGRCNTCNAGKPPENPARLREYVRATGVFCHDTSDKPGLVHLRQPSWQGGQPQMVCIDNLTTGAPTTISWEKLLISTSCAMLCSFCASYARTCTKSCVIPITPAIDIMVSVRSLQALRCRLANFAAQSSVISIR